MRRARQDARAGLRRVAIVGGVVLREAEETARDLLAPLASRNKQQYGRIPECVALPSPPLREVFVTVRVDASETVKGFGNKLAIVSFPACCQVCCATLDRTCPRHSLFAPLVDRFYVRNTPRLRCCSRRRNDWLWLCCRQVLVQLQNIQLASSPPFPSPHDFSFSRTAVILIRRRRDSAANCQAPV